MRSGNRYGMNTRKTIQKEESQIELLMISYSPIHGKMALTLIPPHFLKRKKNHYG